MYMATRLLTPLGTACIDLTPIDTSNHPSIQPTTHETKSIADFSSPQSSHLLDGDLASVCAGVCVCWGSGGVAVGLLVDGHWLLQLLPELEYHRRPDRHGEEVADEIALDAVDTAHLAPQQRTHDGEHSEARPGHTVQIVHWRINRPGDGLDDQQRPCAVEEDSHHQGGCPAALALAVGLACDGAEAQRRADEVQQVCRDGRKVGAVEHLDEGQLPLLPSIVLEDALLLGHILVERHHHVAHDHRVYQPSNDRCCLQGFESMVAARHEQRRGRGALSEGPEHTSDDRRLLRPVVCQRINHKRPRVRRRDKVESDADEREESEKRPDALVLVHQVKPHVIGPAARQPQLLTWVRHLEVFHGIARDAF
mmetsp:Transcript_53890/g.135425  ORF Transcript_53890/g.135425 Transcript_53890/m.135425 type:complete len:366 (-) Transcript_53890:1505-2602(-)